jgi:hypothetical protein
MKTSIALLSPLMDLFFLPTFYTSCSMCTHLGFALQGSHDSVLSSLVAILASLLKSVMLSKIFFIFLIEIKTYFGWLVRFFLVPCISILWRAQHAPALLPISSILSAVSSIPFGRPESHQPPFDFIHVSSTCSTCQVKFFDVIFSMFGSLI